MNLYLLPTLIGALWSLALGMIVIVRSRQARVNMAFSFLCFAIFTWLTSYTVAYFTKNIGVAAIACRIACTAVILVNPLFYDFAVSYLKIDKERKFVVLAYVVTVLMVPFFLFTNVFLDIPHKYYWGYYSKAGPYHPFYLVIFFVIFLRSIYLWFKAFLTRKTLPSIENNRLKYLFAVAILIMLAGSDYLQKYGIEIYPFGWIFVVLYCTVAFMAILRYQLLEIEVIIKKTLVFASLFTVVFGLFVGMTLLTQQFFGRGNLLGFAISSLIIIFTVRPLETFLINITDKYLFQKKYDPFQLLKTFSDEVLASVLDKEAIIKIAVELLGKALNLETFAVMLINKDGGKYEVTGSFGIDNKNIEFSNSSHLVMYLNKTFSHIIKKSYDKGAPGDLVLDMDKIRAELCMPLVFHKHLVGFLAFGKRKSDKEYTNEDLDILIPLTRDIAIAIVYAGLYEEVRQKDKLATLGTLVAGIKHEIGNPLSSILTSTQVFMKDMEEWDTAGMPQKEREAKVKNMVNDVLFEARRIGRITRKFTDFARPGDEGMKEVISIDDSIKEAVEILENELSLRHIKIEKDIPQDMPSIYVDKDQIHQIFFNLLRNAAQAIEDANKSREGAKIAIVVRKKTGDRVTIDISDTGCGIPEEKRAKIFEPFYTTKESGKGTGLGLAIVRQLVGKNRGDISFKSREGEGTTFTLEFPMAKNG